MGCPCAGPCLRGVAGGIPGVFPRSLCCCHPAPEAEEAAPQSLGDGRGETAPARHLVLLGAGGKTQTLGWPQQDPGLTVHPHIPVWDPGWIPGPVLGPFIPCTALPLGRGSPGNPTLKPDPSAGEPPGPGSGCRALSFILSSVLGGRASPPASPLTSPLSPSLHAVPAVG